jgi:prepilin-type processing-associated H-X9-DG protein
MFYMNSKVTYAKIQDGSSKTAMICELRPLNNRDWRGIMHYTEGPLYHHNHTPNSSVADEIRDAACYSKPEAPCRGIYYYWNTRNLTMSARSTHPGGVNLLRADGSALFVHDMIDANVWKGLATLSADANEGYGQAIDSQ